MTPPDTLSLPGFAEPLPAPGQNAVGGMPQRLMSRLLRDAKPLALRRGEVLFQCGEPSNTCFLVRQGFIKVSIDAPTGEQRIVGLHGADSLVGELSMIDGWPRLTTAEAMTDTDLLVMHRCSFLAELRAHPEIYPEIVAMLSHRIRQMTEEVTLAAFLPMKARIAGALLRLGQLMGEQAGVDRLGFRQPVSQADIAAMAGVARESVSRTMAEWRSAGPIGPAGQFRLVIDVRKLADEAMRHE
jgi:CRP/FNR family transcriptional regulator